MRNRPLGRTGLFVSEICLGTMTFGGGEGMWARIGNLQQAESERLIGQALDAGINFIDTADMYSGWPRRADHRAGAEESIVRGTNPADRSRCRTAKYVPVRPFYVEIFDTLVRHHQG